MLLGTTTDHKLQSTLFDFLSDLDICDVSKELEFRKATNVYITIVFRKYFCETVNPTLFW